VQGNFPALSPNAGFVQHQDRLASSQSSFMHAYKVGVHASFVRCSCMVSAGLKERRDKTRQDKTRQDKTRQNYAFWHLFNEKAGLIAYPSRFGDVHELLSFMHKGTAISRLLPQLHKGHPSLHGLPYCLCIAALASGVAGRVCHGVQA